MSNGSVVSPLLFLLSASLDVHGQFGSFLLEDSHLSPPPTPLCLDKKKGGHRSVADGQGIQPIYPHLFSKNRHVFRSISSFFDTFLLSTLISNDATRPRPPHSCFSGCLLDDCFFSFSLFSLNTSARPSSSMYTLYVCSCLLTQSFPLPPTFFFFFFSLLFPSHPTSSSI